MKKNILILTFCLSLFVTTEAFANALVDAAAKGNISAVKNFLDNRGYGINTTDKNRKTALMAAIQHKRGRMVEFLLSRKSNVNAKDKGGNTALTYAARLMDFDRNTSPSHIMHLLLRRGASVNVLNNRGNTILLEICGVKFTNLHNAKFLLESGINVNAKNHNGTTALDYAVMWGNPKLVELLVQFNAHIDARDKRGYTPLLSVLARFADLEAASPGQFMGNSNVDPKALAKIVRIFLDNGADANIMGRGDTPLKLAKRSRNADMIRLVKRYGAQ